MASAEGFSLRTFLTEKQGVTDEQAMREHLAIAYKAVKAQPLLDVSRYRVNPSDPNRMLKRNQQVAA